MRRFPPKGPILDVGGGNGFVSLGLKRSGIQAIVLEPGPGAEVAHSRGLPVIRASLDKAVLRDESICAIGMFDVLEHIQDDRSALVELRRILAPNGSLYLTVPAFPLLWSAEDEAVGHARRYTLASLTRAFSASGLTMLFGTYFFRPLLLPVLLARSVPSLFGFSKVRGLSRKTDYLRPPGMVGQILDQALISELKSIDAGRRLLWGSSILAVGRRSNDN